MDDEEAEAMLRMLRGALAEAGFDMAASPPDVAPEDGPAPGVRGELLRVVERYEEILVLAPKTVAATMRTLDARSIEFAPDRSDLRFAGTNGRRRAAESPASVTMTGDGLAEWMGIASDASVIIAEIRGTLDGDQG